MNKYDVINCHHSLCEGRTLLCMGLISRKLQVLTYVFLWLYFTLFLTSFSSINHLFCLCTWFLILFHLTYRVVQKGYLFCFSSQSCVLQFFPCFSGGVGSRPERFFWHQYGSTGRFTTQQRVKIIEEYFATKSVLLTQRRCRRDLGRNNV